MFYALIMYCTGACPGWVSPPTDVKFFSSVTDCRAELATKQKLIDRSNNDPLVGIQIHQACTPLVSDKKQLDRIIDPDQLEKLIDEYDKKFK